MHVRVTCEDCKTVFSPERNFVDPGMVFCICPGCEATLGLEVTADHLARHQADMISLLESIEGTDHPTHHR